MSGWEVIGVFVGIPVLVLVVIALPIFGPVWWRALRRRGNGATAVVDGEDTGEDTAPPTRPANEAPDDQE